MNYRSAYIPATHEVRGGKTKPNLTLTPSKTNKALILLGQSRFPDQKQLVTCQAESIKNLQHGKHRTWCLEFRVTDGTIQFVDKPNPHLNEKSTQCCCQLSCRALDQPDYFGLTAADQSNPQILGEVRTWNDHVVH